MKQLLIFALLLLGCFSWAPQWKNDTGYWSSTPYPILKLAVNYTGYEDLYLDRNVDETITSTEELSQTPFYRVQALRHIYLTKSENDFYYRYIAPPADWEVRFITPLKSGNHIVVVYDGLGFFTRWSREDLRWQRFSVPPTVTKFTSLLSLEAVDRLAVLIGDSSGGLSYLDLSTSVYDGALNSIPTNHNSPLIKMIRLPLSDSILLFFEDGYAATFNLKDNAVIPLSATTSQVKFVLPYETFQESTRLIINEHGSSVISFKNTALAGETVISPLDNSWDGQQVCDLVLGSNRNDKDILIAGLCNGEVWYLDLASASSRQWIAIFRDAESGGSPIKELQFNWIQSTPSSDNSRIQRGKPVVVIVRENGLCYLYEFATQQITPLTHFNNWGASSIQITSNLVFLPTASLFAERSNPNFAYRSSLALGLNSGDIYRLTNLYFIQPTPAFDTHRRKVFNNASLGFQGLNQRKQRMSWASIAKSLIQFYRSDLDLTSENICSLYSEHLPLADHLDCCAAPSLTQGTVWASSADMVLPACRQSSSNSIYSIITALDNYHVQAIAEDKIPSFHRIVTEITNNRPIVLVLEGANGFVHHIAVIGYQPAQKRIIVWDPSYDSLRQGETTIPYTDLSAYVFDESNTLSATKTIYTC